MSASDWASVPGTSSSIKEYLPKGPPSQQSNWSDSQALSANDAWKTQMESPSSVVGPNAGWAKEPSTQGFASDSRDQISTFKWTTPQSAGTSKPFTSAAGNWDSSQISSPVPATATSGVWDPKAKALNGWDSTNTEVQSKFYSNWDTPVHAPANSSQSFNSPNWNNNSPGSKGSPTVVKRPSSNWDTPLKPDISQTHLIHQQQQNDLPNRSSPQHPHSVRKAHSTQWGGPSGWGQSNAINNQWGAPKGTDSWLSSVPEQGSSGWDSAKSQVVPSNMRRDTTSDVPGVGSHASNGGVWRTMPPPTTTSSNSSISVGWNTPPAHTPPSSIRKESQRTSLQPQTTTAMGPPAARHIPEQMSASGWSASASPSTSSHAQTPTGVWRDPFAASAQNAVQGMPSRPSKGIGGIGGWGSAKQQPQQGWNNTSEASGQGSASLVGIPKIPSSHGDGAWGVAPTGEQQGLQQIPDVTSGASHGAFRRAKSSIDVGGRRTAPGAVSADTNPIAGGGKRMLGKSFADMNAEREKDDFANAIGLFVYGLPPLFKVKEVVALFGQFGDVVNAHIQFDAVGCAARAIQATQGKTVTASSSDVLEVIPDFGSQSVGTMERMLSKHADLPNEAPQLQSTQRDSNANSQNNTLHIANAPLTVTKSDVEKFLGKNSDARFINIVPRPKEKRNMIFITFKNNMAASKVLAAAKTGKHFGMPENLKIEFSKAETRHGGTATVVSKNAASQIPGTGGSGGSGKKKGGEPEKPPSGGGNGSENSRPNKKASNASIASSIASASVDASPVAAGSVSATVSKKQQKQQQQSQRFAHLFVRDVSESSTEESLRNSFTAIGAVDACYIFPKLDGVGRYGIVSFSSGDDAARAVREKTENCVFPRQRRLTVRMVPKAKSEQDISAAFASCGEIKNVVGINRPVETDNAVEHEFRSFEIEFARGEAAMLAHLLLAQKKIFGLGEQVRGGYSLSAGIIAGSDGGGGGSGGSNGKVPSAQVAVALSVPKGEDSAVTAKVEGEVDSNYIRGDIVHSMSSTFETDIWALGLDKRTTAVAVARGQQQPNIQQQQQSQLPVLPQALHQQHEPQEQPQQAHSHQQQVASGAVFSSTPVDAVSGETVQEAHSNSPSLNPAGVEYHADSSTAVPVSTSAVGEVFDGALPTLSTVDTKSTRPQTPSDGETKDLRDQPDQRDQRQPPRDRESIFDFGAVRRRTSFNINGSSDPVASASSAKEHSILYRIFHPHEDQGPVQQNSGAQPSSGFFGKSRRNYNGSESEFESDTDHSSDAGGGAALDQVLGQSVFGSAPQASPSVSGHNQSLGAVLASKSLPRSSIPRIGSNKDLTLGLFDSRRKSRPNLKADSESESEAESPNGFGKKGLNSRPSIFKGLLDKNANNSINVGASNSMRRKTAGTVSAVNLQTTAMGARVTAPVDVPQAPKTSRSGSDVAASHSDSDTHSDTDHHGSQQSSSIFKNIMMGGKRRTTMIGPRNAANMRQNNNSQSSLSTLLPQSQQQVQPTQSLGSSNITTSLPNLAYVNSGGERSGSESSMSEKYGTSNRSTDRILGRGATAVVRLCSPVNSDKKFAIKEFRPKRKDEKQKEYVKKLIAEFCISSTLDHENIIKTVDLIQDDKKTWCVVMEFAEGGDLYSKIHAGLLTDEYVIDCFFKQLLKGVAYLHSMGVAHRDLKPENLLLDKTARILKITDFGVSEVFRAPFESLSKKAHGMCGSGPYIAPEEYTQKEYDSELVDVWACGII
ncbi:serine/threonine-protein kinase HAL4/sat4 [Entophlyctis luteolus]|nr:serine/threonine-protein kinase HAL4/sat4 [Entophlyctis luteolus]